MFSVQNDRYYYDRDAKNVLKISFAVTLLVHVSSRNKHSCH
jgi:hypothetical protein